MFQLIVVCTERKQELKVLNKNLINEAYFKDNDFVLFRDDCLNILRKMSENSVDLIFADPPYNLSNGGFTNSGGKTVSVNKGEWDKSKGPREDFKFHKKWIEACWRVLKPGGTILDIRNLSFNLSMWLRAPTA